MSTPAHHNDELFRQGLDDYREMPSPNVWKGIETALDQEKKKRRFLFWLWFAGGGSSLAAILLLVPVLLREPDPQASFAARSIVHAAPSVKQVSGQPRLADTQTNTVPGQDETLLAQPAKGTTPAHTSSPAHATTSPTQQPHSTVAQATNLHQPVVHKNNIISFKSTNKNNSKTTESTSRQAASPAIGATEPAPTGSVPTAFAATAAGTTRTPMATVTLAQLGMEAPVLDSLTQPSHRQNPGIAVPVVAPLLQPVLSVQGYTGAVAYRRGQPTAQTGNDYVLALPNEQTQAPKKFGLYSGVTLKAGLVIKRHWYVNVGIGYENHYFADRYQFQVPGELYSSNDTASLNPQPTETAYEGIATNAAFGNAVIPLPPGPPATDITAGVINDIALNGKLTYQLHQLILPIDFGYRYSYKRIGVYVGGSAAFHVPLAQKALFYADSGPVREVKLSPVSPFNFSVGVEPGIEYNFAKRFSLLAGGTFRYQVLNAHKGGQLSKPYILSGHLGIRVSL